MEAFDPIEHAVFIERMTNHLIHGAKMDAAFEAHVREAGGRDTKIGDVGRDVRTLTEEVRQVNDSVAKVSDTMEHNIDRLTGRIDGLITALGATGLKKGFSNSDEANLKGDSRR